MPRVVLDVPVVGDASVNNAVDVGGDEIDRLALPRCVAEAADAREWDAAPCPLLPSPPPIAPPPGCDTAQRPAWSSPTGAHRVGAVQLTRRGRDLSIGINQ